MGKVNKPKIYYLTKTEIEKLQYDGEITKKGKKGELVYIRIR